MTKELETTFLKALEQNQQKLLRICSVYAKDAEDTKDLFQEVLIHVWNAMPTFNANASLATWMYRITLNVCLRIRSKDIKKQKKILRMNSITIGNLPTEPTQTDNYQQLILLRSCIKKLHEADRAVIALYLEELPYKEISNITGLTENNIAVKIKRIKKKLLNCINEKL